MWVWVTHVGHGYGYLVGMGMCYDSIATFIFTDNCFSFMSTLADAMHSMDVSCAFRTRLSRTPASRITCHRLMYSYVSVPFHVSLYLYQYGLLTRLRLLVCFTFPLLSCRLVYLCFSFTSFSFCLVDSSMLTLCSSSTRLPYVCTCIS